MEHTDGIQCFGEVEMLVEWADGRQEKRVMKNTVLRKGREALASSIANSYGSTYDFFISRMLFGNGGTAGGVPKYVNADRNGLFGLTLVSKPVSRIIDPNFPYQVIFTSVITKEEAQDEIINEMALQMNNGDLYSMVTLGDVTKSASMQITWTWKLGFI